MHRDDDARMSAVPEGVGRKPDEIILGYVEQFRTYKIGHSFFVAGYQASDLEFLRKPFERAGLKCSIRQVQQDAIYGVAGVRVVRVEGPEDEL